MKHVPFMGQIILAHAFLYSARMTSQRSRGAIYYLLEAHSYYSS